MIDCELKQYCNDDCESCKYAKDQEKRQALNEAVETFKSAILEMLNPTINMVIETIEKIMDATLHLYPNKKVKHLALHHPKERTRKKNINRIYKWIIRESKRKEEPQ